MSVDKDTVRRIARLARIAVNEAELEPMAQELNTIIGWVEQLAGVDTKNVEPMTSAVQTTLKRRDDSVTTGHMPQDILRNAPASEHGFFVVPKVIE